MSYFTRTDRSHIAEWYRTVDHSILVAVSMLMIFGIVAVIGAAPIYADRFEVAPNSLIYRELVLAFIAFTVFLVSSMLPSATIRRLSAMAFIGGLVLILVVILFSEELNGSRRWLDLGFMQLQPSELSKPAFIVITGWLLAEWRAKDMKTPLFLSLMALVLFVGLLVLEPDIGQVSLVSSVWAIQLFTAGIPWWVVFSLMGLGISAMMVIFLSFPHVMLRLLSFVNHDAGDNFQVARSLEAIRAGGWFGNGIGEGVYKARVPDVHTDFIFALIGEEFGIFGCLLVIAMIMWITLRLLLHAYHTPKDEHRIVLSGFAGLFALQSLINISVALGLLPATGMTLPFISYGGTSLIAMAAMMGCCLSYSVYRMRSRSIFSLRAPQEPLVT